MEDQMRRMRGGNNINSVFYAESYHPIQAGSIDGTDILPHDNAVYRALLCSSVGLYDPFGDPKATGDPYCTVFVGRLSRLTTEETLRKVMSKYGRVKNLRLVRDIVTGASHGYAFVEYETEKEMWRAYEDAHHSIVDDCEILVDYNRQQLMAGWIPRRRPIPYKDLERLGIPPPPEGRYMSRFQVPSPPKRERNVLNREDGSHRGKSSNDRMEGALQSLADIEERCYKCSSIHQEDHSYGRSSLERREERGGHCRSRSSAEKKHHRRSSAERREHSRRRKERDEHSQRRQKHGRYSHHEE